MASEPGHGASPTDNFKPTVFFGAISLIGLLILFALYDTNAAAERFNAVQLWATSNFGWLLVLTVNILLICCVYMAFSRMGGIRLGGRGAKPDYGLLTWFAMLFSAGMGIGLLFYGVAEPVMHFSNPPVSAFSNPDAAMPRGIAGNAQHAMGLVFLHWGLHAWAIYAVIALGLAYVAYNRGVGLSIGAFLKTAFPRIPDPAVDAIDVLAITATVCGVAASLGFGASQINAGLNLLTGVPDTGLSKGIVIAIITAMATTSVAFGLDKGIRRLSEINMVLALGLTIFVLVLGPTVFLLDGFVQNIGYYLQRFLYLSSWTETYVANGWQNDWTIFYWAWWVSWSPFVGIFIARISYGRTVREFIAGVLLVPTLFTFAWMTIFGDSALYIELFGNGGLSEAVNASMPDALFAFLSHYPLATIASGLAIVVVATFFVTSADSGALVTAMIASGGHHHAGFMPRVTWAIAIGMLSGVLLWSGGLGALQTAAIVTGLPFAVVLLSMTVGLIRMLRSELPLED
ncbi:choline/glycine/proline betaine transport protein [Altererythrobacter atlanticus]|uniref:Glycine betaine transporter OpuD n=1 Tax=Croceibacterium atlanticum TaxID=1267766 RepID=A0A0F7KWC6_9SPHN|nr:BCCT family transporter [Croceibacterium atlanticum]AKH44019.1 Glycine betaine transporter OpuD [Croceibacterium atlanticum]MBB5732326.1 choline/glycine/proline betaine transport protein [Croceibacterium atlanticum]